MEIRKQKKRMVIIILTVLVAVFAVGGIITAIQLGQMNKLNATTGDAMDVVRDYAGTVTGVFHCFGGSVETARELLKLGWYLGFTGVLTFKNARKAVEVVDFAPLSRLFLETDAPYMAPEPYRGRRCDSRMLSRTCERMAAIKGVTPEECARITQQNARRFFGL